MKLAGSRLGPYEIQSSIGAGGMGEVYRARDTRLDRLVAVKVIAGAAAFDPDFRERFDREARAISSLDHPHICTLFDVGHEGGVDFLVMQLLEGHTLAERLARGGRPSSDPSTGSGSGSTSITSKGPLGIDQALRYAAEIADALDAAHKRGIVHRDLKPGNIFVTKTGTKLLDFGLAKLAAQPVAAGLEEFATRTVPLTGTGSIVGTLNYMTPEQLEGGPIDTRTDIFAFGAVLFEMVTGRRAFDAQSHAGLIAAILNEQPPALTDLSDTRRVLPASAHRALDRLIRKCLAKDPDDRWQSAADLASELRWIDQERLRLSGQTEADIAVPASQPVSKRRERLWMAAAVVAVLGAAAIATWALRPAPPQLPLRFAIPGDDLAPGAAMVAVSPDGRNVAVVTGRAHGERLAIRSMDSEDLRVLAGTEGAWQPVWSPDGRSLLFNNSRNGGPLKRVGVDGGPVITVAHGVRGRPSWGSSDTVLFNQEGSLFTAPANGGPVTPATQLDATTNEIGHGWPQFLPDGRRFLYVANHNDRTKNAIYLGTLGSSERTRIIAADSSFELSKGHLLFQRDGTLFAQAFDMDKGAVVGDPRPIVEGVAFNTANGRTTVSASASANVLAYRLGGAALAGRTILQWVDLQGKPMSTMGEPSWTSRTPAISRDGLRVAVARLEEDGTTDLYVIDVDRNVPIRLTSAPGNDQSPVWSADGAWIYFSSSRNNRTDIYRRAASGSGVDELVYEAKEFVAPTAISRDGEVLLFTRGMGPATSRDIWGMRLRDRTLFQVVSTNFDDEGARFSPDGNWIGYHSDDLDERQVYAEPYPPTGDRVRLSPTSGTNPSWSADGRTIYYVEPRTKVMAVDVRPVGKILNPSPPRDLFTPNNLVGGGFLVDHRKPRFLMLVTADERTPQPIKVILNWQAALLK